MVEERKQRKGRINLVLPEKTLRQLDEYLKGSRGGSVQDVVQRAVEHYLAQRRDTDHELECLTPRQTEVLQLVAQGNKTKEIARKLDISVKTVEMHRAQLMEALDLHSIADLVRFAIRMGMISA
jgi:DNA-binding NarL/FixJ family response regulator